MNERIDVLAVMDRAAEVARTRPNDGQHYPAALDDGTHAVMRMCLLGLGGRARGGRQIETRPTMAEAVAECDRLNGYAEARAAVAELIAAFSEGKNVTYGRILFDEAGANRLRAALARVGAP